MLYFIRCAVSLKSVFLLGIYLFLNSSLLFAASENSWQTAYQSALQYIENQNYEQAESILQELLDENKKLPQAWYGMGLLKRAQGVPDEAIKKFERAIRYDNDYTMAYYQIGKTYATMENGSLKALDNFKKAVRRDEHLIDGYLEITRLHIETEWRGEALKALTEGIANNPDSHILIEKTH